MQCSRQQTKYARIAHVPRWMDGGGGGDDANDCSTSEEEEEEVYLTAQVATSLIRISPIKQVNSILLSG